MRSFLALLSLVASSVWAQAPAVSDRAPTLTAASPLQCPAGTHQVGGPSASGAKMGCAKTSSDGAVVFHGPIVSFWASGKVEAVGQVANGLRVGTWTLYDPNGVKVGQTEFAEGDYHGRRTEFFSTGAPKLEETWVKGKLEGVQKVWAPNGTVSITEFKDGHQVTK